MPRGRRTHSSIDKLPKALQDVLTRMLLDGEWPDDFSPAQRPEGKPTYVEMASYCDFKGHAISKSAVGRWAKPMRVLALMKESGLIARSAMKGLSAERASETQKAAAEMMTAIIIQFAAEHDDFSSKQIKEMSQAIRDCAGVCMKADTYIRRQVGERVKTAAASTKKKLTRAGVNRKLIQEIIDEHLGVVKS